MSLGTIIQFPITTILEYATSGRYGLCPQLKSSVRQLSLSDKNTPPSEKAVRDAIDIVSETIYYENVGGGYNIYNSSSGDIAYYNTINVSGSFLTGYMTDNLIVISGYGTNITSGAVSTGSISVQGGLYQYSNNYDADNIQATGNIIANGKIDDVIGKMFAYCYTPFEQNGSTYSIGIDTDTERYTIGFPAPSAIGLIPLVYNSTMSKEYDWLNIDRQIKIYRHGTQCTSGKLGVSIFYDKVAWHPNYGYICNKTETQRFNLSNETDCIQGYSLISEDNPGTISNNYYIYSAGGTIAGGTYTTSIRRYDSKNDTIAALTRGNLVGTARAFLCTIKSATKMYFACGGAATQYGTVEYVQFATDSANASINTTLTSRTLAGSVYDNIKGYIAGGYKPTESNQAYNIVEKIIYSSDTSYTAISNLGNNRWGMSRLNTNIEGWLIGGTKYNTSYYDNQNYIDKINYSTDTINSSSSILVLNYCFMQSIQNNTYGYLCAGRSYNISDTGTSHNEIQKVTFASDTYYIIPETIEYISQNDVGASV